MTFKEIQNLLKTEIKVTKTLKQLKEFFQEKGVDAASLDPEDVIEMFQKEKDKSALSKSNSEGKVSRSELSSFEYDLKDVKTDEETHKKILDTGDAAFDTAVTQVAETNVEKAITFPQAVAFTTYELLKEKANQERLKKSVQESAWQIEQMIYGFNPYTGE